MSTRTDLDRCEKSRPPPGFDSQTVHPVASRYTDCAMWVCKASLILGPTVLTPRPGIRIYFLAGFTKYLAAVALVLLEL
jgi:hypothetical protein